MQLEPKGRPRIEARKEATILRLRLAGWTYDKIARAVGVAHATAFAVIRNAAERSLTPARRRRDARLPERIWLWRVVRGWSLRRVAAKLGISPASVHAWANVTKRR